MLAWYVVKFIMLENHASMINVTKSMRAPDDQHPDQSYVWSQVRRGKQDAECLVELKWPADTQGASVLFVCLRGEL